MKKPNSELFRLLRFAIKYPVWHTYDPSCTKHVMRGAKLDFFEVNTKTKQFRLWVPINWVFDK